MTTRTDSSTTKIDTTHRMECMELWGGSGETDTAVTMTGLNAHVFSRAYGRGKRGGDVYYFSSCASGRISRVLLADVTGHGEVVAETATSLRDVMRRNVNVIRQSNLMAAINREFGQMTESGGFATAVVATYFSPSRSLTISLAGHPLPLLYRESIGEWALFSDDHSGGNDYPQDLPLGVIESADYSSTSIVFEPGDMLLAYTDAFIEAHNAAGEMLQTQGLLQLVNEAPSDKRAEIIPWLLGHLQLMSDDNLHRDDATLILLQPTGRSIPLKDNLLAPFRMVRGVAEVGAGPPQR